jgi:hypothetical protein
MTGAELVRRLNSIVDDLDGAEGISILRGRRWRLVLVTAERDEDVPVIATELRIGAPEVRRSKGQRWRSATGDVQANGSGTDSMRATVVGPAEPDE